MRAVSLSLIALFLAGTASAQESPARRLNRFFEDVCGDTSRDFQAAEAKIAKSGKLYSRDATQSAYEVDKYLVIFAREKGTRIAYCSVAGRYDASIEELIDSERKGWHESALIKTAVGRELYVSSGFTTDPGMIVTKAYKSTPNENSTYRIEAIKGPRHLNGHAPNTDAPAPPPAAPPPQAQGSLLDQERRKNAATMSMKCNMDGRVIELQVANGRGLMGPFPMDDLEIDKSEIAFKFQGVVHYFDFAKRTGRRSFMGVNQGIDCF